jgi:hypothetical protein
MEARRGELLEHDEVVRRIAPLATAAAGDLADIVGYACKRTTPPRLQLGPQPAARWEGVHNNLAQSP